MKHTSRLFAVLLAGVCAAPQLAHAAGFYLQEQSAAMQGMSFAGVAADPQDASIVYYNPAGMTLLNGAQSSAGVSVIAPSAKLKDRGTTVTTGGTTRSISATSDDGGNPYSPTPVPHGYIAMPVNDSKTTWLGLSITFPFGMSNEYDQNFFGRYDSTKTVLRVMDVSPAVGYAPYKWLSIGGGMNVQHVDAQLAKAYTNSAAATTPTTATDGWQDLSGEDNTVGYNLGAIVTPVDGTRVGLHYRSAINHDVSGRLITKLPTGLGGTFVRFPGSAKLKLPDMATLAISQDLNEKWTVDAHTVWYGWSNFNELAINLDGTTDTKVTQNYKNTIAFALGARYKMDDQWTFRAGYQFDPTPTQDNFRTTLTPDGNRHWISGGATYKVTDALNLDLGATYIKVMKENIDLERSFLTGTASIHGTTEADIGILSAGLSYKF